MANYGEMRVHTTSPSGMYGSGNIEVYRSGSTIRAYGTNNWRVSSSSWFGFKYAAAIYWNGNLMTWWYIKNDISSSKGISRSVNFDYSFNDNSSGTLELVYVCCGANDGSGRFASCTVDAANNHMVVYSVGIGPGYTPPSIWLNPNDYTQIGRVGVSEYWVHYSLSKGTENLHYTLLSTFDYNASSWSPKWEKTFNRTSSSDGYWDSYVLPSGTFANGSRYRIKMLARDTTDYYAISPDGWTPTNGLVIYTYQEPTINTSISCNTAQNATKSNTFTVSGTNDRAWSSYENQFQTHYRISLNGGAYSSWTNIGTSTSWSRTADQMRSLIPKQYDNTNCTIQMKRYSPSSNWYSSNTASATIKVSYRPRVGISSGNTSYRQNTSTGSSITKGQYLLVDSNFTGVYVAWSYDLDAYNAGYTQGYRIRLYDKNSNVVKTYYTSNKYYTIPKADIPKIQSTYLDITPYYKNDSSDSSQYWYYSGTIEKFNFVHLITVLDTPVITYPVQNSNWINSRFRVCFTLPNDGDKGYEPETYHYDNIELQVNGSFTIRMKNSTGQTSTGTNLICAEAFSALPDNLTYQRKIIINPSLASGFPTASSYSIRVRVRKKYTEQSSVSLWSSWSDARIFTVSSADYTVNRNDIIRATHYNVMKSAINRVRNTYGVSWTIPEEVAANTTKILRNQYDYIAMHKAIADTKSKVNTFGTFDTNRNGVKFDCLDSIPTSFTPIREIVTASANDNDIPLITPETNLFNKDTVTLGCRISSIGGTLYQETGYFTSDYIKVTPGSKYTFNYTPELLYNRIAFYKYKSISSYVSQNDGGNATITVPAGAEYMRFGQSQTNLNTIQVQQGTSSTPFEPFKNYDRINQIDDTELAIGDLLLSGFPTTGGSANRWYYTANFTKVPDFLKGQTVTGYKYNNGTIATYNIYAYFYTNKTTLLGSRIGGHTITIPSDAVYMRIMSNRDDKELKDLNIMLVKGSVSQANMPAYEPYDTGRNYIKILYNRMNLLA